MNLLQTSRKSVHGGVLLVTLLICVILGVLIGSYLSLIQGQNLSVTRAQAWNAALPVAEAGVEEAMAHLNSGVSTNKLGVNSWVSLGGGIYEKTNFLGDSYSIVDIKLRPAVTNFDPVIVAASYVPGPVSQPKLTRTIQVTTKPKSIAGNLVGMVVKTTIDLKGSGVSMDSFDSSKTNYSTGGMYDATKSKDQAQSITLSSATNAFTVGNGTIKGTVHTGPGGQVSVSGGSVGDAAWVVGGNQGIESGHFYDDINFTMPDVALPSGKIWLPPIPGNYKINGVTYKYVLNNLVAWKMSNLSGSVYISSPDVVLYVTDSLSIGSGQQITVAPNASVSMYVGAASATIGGQGVVNLGGEAKDFSYYGLPSNTSLDLKANASFTGYIDAPNAAFSLGGGGNNTYDFVGACMVNSVVMNGHFNFHYDEALGSTPVASGYVAISWDEL